MAAGVQHRASPEALGMKTRQRRFTGPHPGSFEGTRRLLDYEGREIRRVLAHGKISFHGHGIYISGSTGGMGRGAGRSAWGTDRVVVRPPAAGPPERGKR